MSPSVPDTGLACLPYEIRSYIWSLAVEPRHIYQMGSKRREFPVREKRRRRRDLICETTSTPAPVVMHVCRESRQHGPYRRAFTAGTNPRWTWVNFEHDIFSVSSVFGMRSIVSHRSDIQRLEIRTDDDDDWYDAATIYNAMDILREFTSLREIRVVMEPGDLMWADVYANWHTFGLCPQANVMFIEEMSGLVLTGPQLQMVDDWRTFYSFDSKGNPPDPDMLSESIEYDLSGYYLSLTDMHNID
ncbi:hypothetical protein K4F52_004139 [Lecanicillium sp. MT-2017a]|nr:hypothetical protein K4F52_004139 [Lecanicillium sp. MT-2017a]